MSLHVFSLFFRAAAPLIFVRRFIFSSSADPSHTLQGNLITVPQRYEYIARNVCPSWHYDALYQLTRRRGRERRGRERDVKKFGTAQGPEEERESSLWLLIWQDMKQLNGFGIWGNSFLQWALREASPNLRAAHVRAAETAAGGGGSGKGETARGCLRSFLFP